MEVPRYMQVSFIAHVADESTVTSTFLVRFRLAANFGKDPYGPSNLPSDNPPSNTLPRDILHIVKIPHFVADLPEDGDTAHKPKGLTAHR